ncbi:MAG: glutaminyl-tRNA synthase (glutamine-hydrolyzing) subunit A [Candidatus Vogelbacteria bacterium RIFOXYD1_FULL_46_19]|uniref:Glutamyl-tRNA(Gln) amidotransferase subunit A n=1 Tax=Candidatus Vogelbacteria bacterium RIFOXYD1_FULL_46_19 TaxID=1802439 RepID=A0A1G2QIA3_9BACT|nr:MAG: glutaminyl-tRNA synthase (glutamine-hydrolyzing) subunit A [Candidatus Vogelbacteria bacterium RIFOXYD1_FULL_46_19]
MATDLLTLSVTEASHLLTKKEISAVELAESYLAQIEAKNSDLKAYLEVFADVVDQAKVSDDKRSAGSHALWGIPLAVKDNILIEGRRASSASRILENYVAPYDATVITKLKTAGSVFLGRTNMDEFAMGGSTENSSFGPTKNPHDLSRVPGGSSGGSAAAVGGGLAPIALGSDTGGSIRQPASLCGAVGLKPTYGNVSRYGLMAMASSLDQIGPIARSVADARLLYETIAGRDPLDSTSVELVEPKATPEAFTIGVPYDTLTEGVDEEVLAIFNDTIAKLKGAGHLIREVSLPNLKYSLASYYVLMPAESSTNLGRFDGLRYGVAKSGANLLEDYLKTRGEGFGPEVRRRIILGTYVLSAGYYDAFYGKATAVRELVRQDYAQAFAKKNSGVDIILTPTAPTPAWLIGEKVNDPLQMYLEDIFTVPANLAGIPALSVPAGQTRAGLPVGVQLAGPHFAENNLFALGEIIEQL